MCDLTCVSLTSPIQGQVTAGAVHRFSLYSSASVSRLPSVCQELRSEAMKMKKFSLVGEVPTIMAAHFWVTGAVIAPIQGTAFASQNSC